VRAASSLLALAMLAGVARGEGNAADEAFKKGRELLKDNKFKEACEQFEKSQALDPQLGTQFNIAQCDEKIGKLASAMAIYRELAAKDANAARKAASSERVTSLAPQVPKLIVQIASAPAGLTVQLDGRAIAPNAPVELDFGDYTVVVHAGGFTDFTSKVHVADAGRSTTLVVALVPVAPVVGHDTGIETHEPAPAGPAPSHRKTYAVATIAAGGAVAVTGLVFGVMARSKWNDATAICPASACASQADLDRANALRDSANSRATLSTVLVIGGGVLAAAGVALWVTAPSEQHAVALTAHPSGDGAQVTLSGRF